MPSLADSSFMRGESIRLRLAVVLGGAGAIFSLATIYATPLQNAFVLSCGLQALSCDTALTSRVAAVAGVSLAVLGAAYFLFCTRSWRLHAARHPSPPPPAPGWNPEALFQSPCGLACPPVIVLNPHSTP